MTTLNMPIGLRHSTRRPSNENIFLSQITKRLSKGFFDILKQTFEPIYEKK